MTAATAIAVVHVRTSHAVYFVLGSLLAAFSGELASPKTLRKEKRSSPVLVLASLDRAAHSPFSLAFISSHLLFIPSLLPFISSPFPLPSSPVSSLLLTPHPPAKTLKHLIRQPRPSGSPVTRSHGMPSTHSATISFMGTYLFLSSLYLELHPSLRLSSLSSSHSPPLSPSSFFLSPSSSRTGTGTSTKETDNLQLVTRIWLAIFSFSLPLLVIWSRIRLGVHTRAQCLVGGALGCALACACWALWTGVASGVASGGVFENGLGSGSGFGSGLGLRVWGTRLDNALYAGVQDALGSWRSLSSPSFSFTSSSASLSPSLVERTHHALYEGVDTFVRTWNADMKGK